MQRGIHKQAVHTGNVQMLTYVIVSATTEVGKNIFETVILLPRENSVEMDVQ